MRENASGKTGVVAGRKKWEGPSVEGPWAPKDNSKHVLSQANILSKRQEKFLPKLSVINEGMIYQQLNMQGSTLIQTVHSPWQIQDPTGKMGAKEWGIHGHRSEHIP